MLSALFWKKVWAWVKHYWYWPVIIILLIFSMVSNKGLKEKLFGLLLKSKENYEKEIKVIKEVNEQKDVKKEQAVEEHVEEIRKIEEEHDIKVEELEIEKLKQSLLVILPGSVIDIFAAVSGAGMVYSSSHCIFKSSFTCHAGGKSPPSKATTFSVSSSIVTFATVTPCVVVR